MIAPRANRQLIGHKEAKDLFLKALHSGKVAHAWILSGPTGIGKATFAYHMARYVLSNRQDGNTEFKSDDPLYRRTVAQSHGDLHTLETEGNEISVDLVRQLNSSLNQTQVETGWRVVIIDGADRLNRNAANALLKRLEEPPTQTLFFLTTSYPGKLLPTIRSRCQVLPLNPLTDEQVKLVFISQNLQLPDFTILAQGSPGRLMHMLEGKGPDIYADLQKIYKGEAVPFFAQIYGDDEQSFTTIEDLLRNFLHTELLKKVQDQPSYFNHLGIEQSLDVYEKIEQLFDDCRLAQLDKKATLNCVIANLNFKDAA